MRESILSDTSCVQNAMTENDVVTSPRLQIAKAQLVGTDRVEVCLINQFNQRTCETIYPFGGSRSIESVLTAVSFATLELVQSVTTIQDIYLDELEIHTLQQSNSLVIIAVVAYRNKRYYGITKLNGDDIDELLLSGAKCILSCCNRLLEQFIHKPLSIVDLKWSKRKIDAMREMYNLSYPSWQKAEQDFQPVLE